jgi:hypothetical protein
MAYGIGFGMRANRQKGKRFSLENPRAAADARSLKSGNGGGALAKRI